MSFWSLEEAIESIKRFFYTIYIIMPKRHRLIFVGEVSPCLQPRLSLNSLKSVNPITLKKGSRAIDKGEDLGFPFVGEAPDLGAFEYGMSSSSTTSLFRKVVRNSCDLKSRSVKAFDLQGRFLGKVPVEYGVDFVPNKNVYLKY